MPRGRSPSLTTSSTLSARVSRSRGTRLREIREDAEHGPGARVLRSYTKVSKLENGARLPSQADIREWCWTCHADEQVPELVAAARNIETSAPSGESGSARACAAPSPRLPVYERTTKFRLYEPALVPGIFQTADYAAAIIRSFLLSRRARGEDVGEAVAAGMEWQRMIYGDKGFPG